VEEQAAMFVRDAIMTYVLLRAAAVAVCRHVPSFC